MAKPLMHAGKSYTNADAWRTAKATSPAGPAATAEPEEGAEQEGEMQPHHEQIHEHLRNMHEQTGEAHSHIEHHDDGSHTSHHIDKGGEVHGPHDHANIEELKSAMDQFLNEEGNEPSEEGEERGY
jgi:hypothetical protein